MPPLADNLERQYSLNRLASKQLGFGAYLDSVVINSHPPARFSEVAEWWQWDIVRMKYDAVQELAGFIPYDPARPRRFLSVLPRGHDKSSLEGRIANFLLCFSRQRIDGKIVAADWDQGMLIYEKMEEEAKLNPWFGHLLDFQKKGRIVGPSGVIEIVPADAGGSYGFTSNLYILDEITHWPSSAGGVNNVYKAVITGTGKVPGTIVVGITNAGILKSWQHELVYENAKSSALWRVFDNGGRPGQLASWMTPEVVEEIARSVPKLEARRVLYNEWVDMAVASEFLDALDVALVVRPDARPHKMAMPGYSYCVGVDYGPYKDRTVLCVCHLDFLRNVVVDKFVVLRGDKSKGLAGEVQIADIEKCMEELNELYKPKSWSIDPYQMVNTCQKYEKKHWPIVRVEPRGGNAAKVMANFLRSIVAEHRLIVSPEVNACEGIESFVDELKALVTQYNRLGYRFVNSKDSHDDRAVTVASAGQQCVQFPPTENKEPLVKHSPPVAQKPSGNPLVGWHRN